MTREWQGSRSSLPLNTRLNHLNSYYFPLLLSSGFLHSLLLAAFMDRPGIPVSFPTSQPHECHHHPLSRRDLTSTTTSPAPQGFNPPPSLRSRCVFREPWMTRKQRNAGQTRPQAKPCPRYLSLSAGDAAPPAAAMTAAPPPPRATAAERARPQRPLRDSIGR